MRGTYMRLSNSELAGLIDEHINGRNAQRNRKVADIKRYQDMYKNADI